MLSLLTRFIWILVAALSLNVQAHDNAIGSQVYDLEIRNIETDRSQRISDYSGKVLYIDFWASWCSPCVASMPYLSSLQSRYGSEQFSVISINLDQEINQAKLFLKGKDLAFDIFTTSERELTHFPMPGLPTAYLIDADGKIRLVHHGYHRKHNAFIEAHVNKLVAETKYLRD